MQELQYNHTHTTVTYRSTPQPYTMLQYSHTYATVIYIYIIVTYVMPVTYTIQESSHSHMQVLQ